MLQITDTQLMHWLAVWLWPFLRIGAFVLTAPIIGTRSVPSRVRLVFALSLTMVLAPLVDPATLPRVPLLSADGLLVVVHQMLIGASLGLVLRMIFLVLEFAGQIVAQQMGLGFAAMVDPASGAQVPVLAQFYMIMATLMFFAFDAHLKLIELLADSFSLMPLTSAGPGSAALHAVLDWSGRLLGIGVMIVLPVVASLLVVNLSFGVITRAAPQLNIFAVGFPVMILLGTVVMALSVGTLVGQFQDLFSAGFATAYQLLRLR